MPSSSHFTQIIWNATRSIGCAVNAGCSWSTYACRYSPPVKPDLTAADWARQVPPPIKRSSGSTTKEGVTTSKAGEPMTAAVMMEWEAAGSNVIVPVQAPVITNAGEAAQQLLALQRTNAYRVLHQVSPVTWDDDLAASAAAFTDGCPSVLHSDRVMKYGENVARGAELVDFGAAVNKWYSEVGGKDGST